jgi:hypothetical protein
MDDGGLKLCLSHSLFPAPCRASLTQITRPTRNHATPPRHSAGAGRAPPASPRAGGGVARR